MIRIVFTATDFARVRFAPRPAPLQELNTAFLKLLAPGGTLLHARWRQRIVRTLPAAVNPLADLVPGTQAPVFLDVFAETLQEAAETIRATRPALLRSELERVYAGHAAPAWIRHLHEGADAAPWTTLHRAHQAAFETILRPVWPVVQDLHRAEFTRHALRVAEQGLGPALTALVPGSSLKGAVWELASPGTREIHLGGRGLTLHPTFHWTGHPLPADLPDEPLHLTYPAGPGLPPTATPTDLAAVLGRTRLTALLLLETPHTTTTLARHLGVAPATASTHAAALRAAGLITTTRTGRAVRHERTALGSLLLGSGNVR
ncbi:helix-turn-helix domain-containing protein [Streptomyces sp. NPDC049555]|uniref:ArsR/SmtB family transcription factor n=1 Tax=Streptomyces sp. NPDC049555 TaxID=3154930 RepID=UPI0034396E38